MDFDKIKNIVGIDPGKTNGGIVIYNLASKRWTLSRQPPETDWKEIFGQWDETYIVGVEKQQMRPDDRDSPAFFGLEKLVKQTERMTTVLKTLDVATVEVHVISWQTLHKLRKKEKKDDRKKRYQQLAGQIVGRKVPLWGSDAVLIAYFMAYKMHHDPEYLAMRLVGNPQKSIFEPRTTNKR